MFIRIDFFSIRLLLSINYIFITSRNRFRLFFLPLSYSCSWSFSRNNGLFSFSLSLSLPMPPFKSGLPTIEYNIRTVFSLSSPPPVHQIIRRATVFLRCSSFRRNGGHDDGGVKEDCIKKKPTYHCPHTRGRPLWSDDSDDDGLSGKRWRFSPRPRSTFHGCRWRRGRIRP